MAQSLYQSSFPQCSLSATEKFHRLAWNFIAQRNPRELKHQSSLCKIHIDIQTHTQIGNQLDCNDAERDKNATNPGKAEEKNENG